MQIRLSSLMHAAIGAGVVGAAALFAQPGTDPRPPQPGAPRPDVSQPAAPQPGATQPPAPPAAPTYPDRGQPKVDEGLSQEEMMKTWMAVATPGKPHEFLKTLEGNYTTVTRVWMDPKAPPMQSEGKAVFKMVLGGRFLQQDFAGTMMERPMAGMGLIGYDNHRHQYTGIWTDTFNTTILTMTGGISQDGKTITQFGTMDEPTTRQIGKMVKWVTRVESDSKMFFESWEVESDTPIKVFEVEYTRTK